jgi:hypothetical protein
MAMEKEEISLLGSEAGEGICDGAAKIAAPKHRRIIENVEYVFTHGVKEDAEYIRLNGGDDGDVKLYLEALFGVMRRRQNEGPAIAKELSVAEASWPKKLGLLPSPPSADSTLAG